MSYNKKNGKLDFRNVKMTQFDSSQTNRMEFSELQSAKRVLPTNTILKDAYTHFRQELDGDNRPTKVDYYQALDSTIDKLTFRADSGGDLAGTYYVLTNNLDGKTYAIYQVVSGSGTAPGVADVEIAATYNNNDSATLVAFANKQALANITDIRITYSGILSDFVEIEYLQFGETPVIDLGTTGFTVSRTKEGESYLVTSVELEYDSDGNIIWQEELLKNAVYDPYTASFNFPTKAAITDENGNPYGPDNPLSVQLSDGSVNIGTVNAELEVQLTHLDNDPDAGDVHDSIRIGDGVEELAINADNEALVHDQDTHDKLDILNTSVNDQSDETQTILQTEFDETQVAITNNTNTLENTLEQIDDNLDAEFQATRDLLQSEFDETQVKQDETITELQNILTILNQGTKDPLNSSQVPILDGQNFLGGWQSSRHLSSTSHVIISDTKLDVAKVEWSNDASTLSTGFLASDDILVSEQFEAGLYVYVLIVNTMREDYYRINITNSVGADATVYELATFRYDKPHTGQFTILSQPLSSFSVAQLTRAVITGLDPNGDYVNGRISGKDNNNSTNTLLGAGATFTGTIRDIKGYTGLDITINSDQPSDSLGLLVNFFADEAGTRLTRQVPLEYTDQDNGTFYHIPKQGNYFRVEYTNNITTAQSYFELETHLTTSTKNGLVSKIEDSVNGRLLAQLVKSIQVGVDPSGHYVNAKQSGLNDQNSSLTPLASDGEYVGDWFDTTGYANVQVSLTTDAPYNETFYTDSRGEQGGFLIEVSNNSTGPAVASFVLTTANNPPTEFIYFTPGFRYIRVKYKNDTTAQTFFSLNTFGYINPASAPIRSIGSGLNSSALALTTRGVSFGRQPDGDYVETPSSGSIFSYSTDNGDLPLAADEILETPWIDSDGWRSIEIWITSDVMSADDGIEIERTIDANAETPVASGAPEVYQFNGVDLINGKKVIRLAPELDGFRVRYQNNDTTAQTNFTMEITLHVNPVELPVAEMADQDSDQSKTLRTKGAVIAPDDNREWDIIGRDGNGSSINTFVKEVNPDLVVPAPDNAFESGQLNVSQESPTLIPRPSTLNVENPRNLEIRVQDAYKAVYLGKSNVTELTGLELTKSIPFKKNFGDNLPNNKSAQEIYLIAESGLGSETTSHLEADTVDSSTGVTSPSNIFTDNNSFANFTTTGNIMTISGFDPSILPAGEDVASVSLVTNYRKQPSAPSETVTFVDVVGNTAGNVSQITSGTVTSNPNHRYIVSVARRDEFASVTNVTNNMGFTGFTLLGDTGTASPESRTSTYIMEGSPTQNGTITVAFSQAADYAVITVTRIADVNPSDVAADIVTFATGSNNNVYSGTFSNSTQNGLMYIAMGLEMQSHTALSNPAGGTERFDGGSASNNDQTHAIITAPITTNGGFSFNGTTSGDNDMSYVAIAFNPAPARNPTLEVSHSEGSTTDTITATTSTENISTVDITSDAAFDNTILSNMTVTLEALDVGNASFDVDRVAIRVLTSSGSVKVTYIWTGEK